MNKPSKEEVDKAIKFFTELPTFIEEFEIYEKTALSILTKYRDGELVEKSKLAKQLDFELSLIPKKYASEYEEGIGDGIEKAIHWMNEITSPPTNQRL